MPRISEFYGIIIAMFYNDHNPPHFHATYQGDQITIAIRNFQIIKGSLPSKALSLIIEWASNHQEELLENWVLSKEHRPLKKIDPLL